MTNSSGETISEKCSCPPPKERCTKYNVPKDIVKKSAVRPRYPYILPETRIGKWPPRFCIMFKKRIFSFLHPLPGCIARFLRFFTEGSGPEPKKLYSVLALLPKSFGMYPLSQPRPVNQCRFSANKGSTSLTFRPRPLSPSSRVIDPLWKSMTFFAMDKPSPLPRALSPLYR